MLVAQNKKCTNTRLCRKWPTCRARTWIHQKSLGASKKHTHTHTHRHTHTDTHTQTHTHRHTHTHTHNSHAAPQQRPPAPGPKICETCSSQGHCVVVFLHVYKNTKGRYLHIYYVFGCVWRQMQQIVIYTGLRALLKVY